MTTQITSNMTVQTTRLPFILAAIIFILLVFTLLHQTDNVPDVLTAPFRGDIKARLALSEKLYGQMIDQRHEMIKDYPDPANKNMFPCKTLDDYWRTPFSIWDFVPATFSCPWETERVGRLGDGGKWVCGMSKYEALPKRKPCIIYSFGIQFESSFEEGYLERTHCEIWGYDYSVSKFGEQLKGIERKSHAHFTQAGIAGKTDTTKEPPFYSIQDLMELNGHDHVDVLKIDIEGAEFESMSSLVKSFGRKEVPVGQVMIEIHLEDGKITTDEFLSWWEDLEEVGFRPVWTEPNLLVTSLPFWDGLPRFAEYTLINTRDSKNILLR